MNEAWWQVPIARDLFVTATECVGGRPPKKSDLTAISSGGARAQRDTSDYRQMSSRHLKLLLLSALLPPAAASRTAPRLGRRALLSAGGFATALSTLPASAIVNGDPVSDAEAAAAGVVGLYIDLSGCTVCRKGVPATCTGTLIAPDLVLSARHCSDVPASLNGTLEKVVFGSNMLSSKAYSVPIESFVSTADYGIDTAGNDLLLLKLKGKAPPEWKPVDLPLRLLPTQAEQKEAEKKNSPFFPSGVGLPTVVSYGYGQQSSEGELDASKYSAGELKRIGLQVRTEVRPWGAGFLTTPTSKNTGTCAGDSGGGALLGLQDPSGNGVRTVLLGVQAAASKPCVDNQAVFVYPQAFAEFLEKASKDLGSPLRPGLSWRDY
jgi:hypothetical protein